MHFLGGVGLNLPTASSPLIGTELLQSNQKLQLLQQYLMPILNYSFQITPAAMVCKNWLQRLDLITTSGIRDMLRLPNGSPNDFYYAPRARRGLALVKYEWEARLQRLTALTILHKETLLADRRSAITEEAKRCLGGVQVETPVSNEFFQQPNLSSKLRKQLRERSFASWAAMPGAGKGVALYGLIPASNRWVSSKSPLTQTEWLTALQLTTNTSGVLSHPRMRQEDQRCRRCQKEKETIGHVLGYCPFNNGMIIARHNAIVRLLIAELKKIKYTVYEEVRCVGAEEVIDVASDDPGVATRVINNSRRIDIVAIPEDRSCVELLDPTICIERDEVAVQEALERKKCTYEPTVPQFREQYNISNVLVNGLWFGSRGAHHPSTVFTLKRLKLLRGNSTVLLDTITKIVLQHSTMIMRNHLSGSD